ncbi:MAG TPA: hypothetical protein VIY47_02540 [Ignavibacteriaceae bacterium]
MNTFEILICDPEDGKWEEMTDYILDNNIQMIKYDMVDVSDHSRWDVIASFRFVHEQDALYFKLRFDNGNCG